MQEKQFVIFKVKDEKYGIDIMNIREIAPYQRIDRVPNVLHYIEGVTNFRGHVTPIINMKKVFGLDEEITENERLIVVKIDGKQVGFLVDEASQIIKLNEDEIEKPSQVGVGVNDKFVIGIGKKDDELIILIDLSKVLKAQDIEEIESILCKK